MALPLPTERQRIMRQNNLGMILKWRNEIDAALAVFQDVLDMARTQDSEQLLVYALLELGDVNRINGDFELGRQYLEEALARSDAAQQNRWQVFAHTYLAELEEGVGNAGAARSHRDSVAEIQAQMQDEVVENRATVLEVTLELLEREKSIDRLEMEGELQAVRLDRSRKLSWLAGVASALLLVALWLAIQQVRIRAAANRKLDKLANTDTLTGLFNRRFLISRAHDVLSEACNDQSAGLILIDLDHFKQINDVHGHEHGDAVLVEIAHRIQAMMRNQDVVARWGGEEFLAFLPGCDEKTAVQVAERLRAVIKDKPICHQGVAHQVTATIGVALARAEDRFEHALQRADVALYDGKQQGRNCVRISD